MLLQSRRAVLEIDSASIVTKWRNWQPLLVTIDFWKIIEGIKCELPQHNQPHCCRVAVTSLALSWPNVAWNLLYPLCAQFCSLGNFLFLFLWRFDSIPGRGIPLRGFEITLFGHTILGRTPLDELSAQRRDDTQHSQETDIHAGIQTHNPSKRAAEDPRLRPGGCWHRALGTITSCKYDGSTIGNSLDGNRLLPLQTSVIVNRKLSRKRTQSKTKISL
jgi:hypothetical protein